MKVEAVVSFQGAFVPGMLRSEKFYTIKPLYFLLDTGATISAVSSSDISHIIDLSSLEEREEAAVGVGGALKCYLLHKTTLFLFTVSSGWMEVKSSFYFRTGYFWY